MKTLFKTILIGGLLISSNLWAETQVYFKTRAIDKYKTMNIEEGGEAPILEDIIGLLLIEKYLDTGNPQEIIRNPLFDLREAWIKKYMTDFSLQMKALLEAGMLDLSLGHSIRAVLREAYDELPVLLKVDFYLEFLGPRDSDELLIRYKFLEMMGFKEDEDLDYALMMVRDTTSFEALHRERATTILEARREEAVAVMKRGTEEYLKGEYFRLLRLNVLDTISHALIGWTPDQRRIEASKEAFLREKAIKTLARIDFNREENFFEIFYALDKDFMENVKATARAELERVVREGENSVVNAWVGLLNRHDLAFGMDHLILSYLVKMETEVSYRAILTLYEEPQFRYDIEGLMNIRYKTYYFEAACRAAHDILSQKRQKIANQ